MIEDPIFIYGETTRKDTIRVLRRQQSNQIFSMFQNEDIKHVQVSHLTWRKENNFFGNELSFRFFYQLIFNEPNPVESQLIKILGYLFFYFFIFIFLFLFLFLVLLFNIFIFSCLICFIY